MAAPEAKPKKRRADKKPKRSRKRRRRSSSDFEFSSDDDEPEARVEREPLPKRVIGKHLKLDPKVTGGYRGWKAQDYPLVTVPHTGYFTWSVELRARLFRRITLKRGYFESTGLSGPRTQEAAVAAQVGSLAPKAAWLLAAVGVDINRAWQPVIWYETRAFQTEARPNAPVRVLPHDTPPDVDPSTLPATSEPLRVVSGFETFVAGIQYDHGKDGSAVVEGGGGTMPPIYVGVGLVQYRKPYQLTVGDFTLVDVLFDGRFRGAGLAFGFDMNDRPEQFSVDLDAQVGLGEVRLLEDLTLNEELPTDWLLGYAQGSVTAGYLYPLLRTQPTVFLSFALTGGGVTFFAVRTRAEEGEEVTSPPLNWDFLWTGRLGLTIPL